MGVATYQEGDFQDVLDAISSGKSSFPGNNQMQRLIESMLGRLQPASMITGKIQMDEVEEKGFKALSNDKDNHVKILVEVSP